MSAATAQHLENRRRHIEGVPVSFKARGASANRIVLIKDENPTALTGEKRGSTQSPAARANYGHIDVSHPRSHLKTSTVLMKLTDWGR